MSQFDDIEIFKGKTFANILEEIYVKSKEKDIQLNVLINELKPLIRNVNDATLLMPVLKDYMDIGVKNDEQLIKMLGIVQRAVQAANNVKKLEEGGDYLIDKKEVEYLKQQYLESMDTTSTVDKKIETAKAKVEKIEAKNNKTKEE